MNMQRINSKIFYEKICCFNFEEFAKLNLFVEKI